MNDYLIYGVAPHHPIFIIAHNIVGFLTTIMLFISISIFYLRPPIKESNEYKVTTYGQHSLLFVLCFSWSFIEGYLDFLGISSGDYYSICCLLFGTFVAFLMLSFWYRLRMIADQNHFVQNDTLFYAYYVGVIFGYSILPTLFFYQAFDRDYDLRLHPLNFTNVQILYFSKAAFTYIPIFSFKCMIYIVYYGVALVFACGMIAASFYYILAEIRKKQLVISALTINYHKRTFKTLVIQGGLTLGVFLSAPLALYISLFIHINSILVEMSLVIFGFAFFVHSSISLLFYDVKRSRKAIRNLFFSVKSQNERQKSTNSRPFG